MEELISLDLEESKHKNAPLKHAFGKAKLFRIRRVIRQMKQLSTKKGSSQQIEKNKRKVLRLEQQLETLKDLRLDTFIKTASVKVQGDELNPEDLVLANDEDVATKMNVLEKLINDVGVDNIKNLTSTVKKEEKKPEYSAEAKMSKSPPNISSKADKILPSDEHRFFKVDIQKDKHVMNLDDFFSDPVVENCNSAYIDKSPTFSQKRAKKRRKLALGDESAEISTKALDSVFVRNLKSGKQKIGKNKKRGEKKRNSSKEKRKNRLGQRERRRQWEKLYGNKANHLKKERKRLDISSEGAKRKNRSKVLRGVKKRQAVEKITPSLHPSWEASKSKRKQEAIVEFKGKKIIFED